MPSFDIIREYEPPNSFRAKSTIGAFDIPEGKLKERFKGEIDIENKEWNIGLIVGGSGTGKSTIAKKIFKDEYIQKYEYNAKCVLDDMPSKSIKDIQNIFTNVGFASPPSWLKPYKVLSDGEKMRVDLARALLEEKKTIAFDEFTSVVNREVAKTASLAIQKTVKKLEKKFIAISCHSDIIEWLQPDWIYDTDAKEFFFVKNTTDQKSSLKYTELKNKTKQSFGSHLKNTII